MGARQLEWARKRRMEIVQTLGGFCIHCRTEEKLEIDCIVPTHHTARSRDASSLVSHYNSQLKINNLQLLCDRCHGRKTRIDSEIESQIQSESPF